MNSAEIHPYYLARKPQILAEFLESMRLAQQHFQTLLPNQTFEDLIEPVLAEMERVLPSLPYVGGAEGRMTLFFEKNAGVIALGRVLRGLGVPVGTISKILRKTFLAKLSNLPDADRFRLGREWLSKGNQAQLRMTAQQSRERENPGDFVYEYVEAGQTESGETFEFGLNYHECGFCKLCKASGDDDLLPMMCAMDEESYGLRGVRLYRTTTLAGGDSHCNFRFGHLPEAAKE